jgi:membrane-associated phospholipid phosphatase
MPAVSFSETHEESGGVSGGARRPVSWRSFAADGLRRLRLHWRFKLLLELIVGPVFCAIYFLIGYFPLMPEHRLSLAWVDRAIGFHPNAWVCIYQSLYIPINLIPWLADRRDDLRRYVGGLAWVSGISFAIFILFPFRAPKPPMPDAHGMCWLLNQYDATLNSLPSLHVSLLIYALAFGRRSFRGRVPRLCSVFCLLWGAAICYATLATKEHYALDTIAGAILALAVDAAVWRQPSAVTRTKGETTGATAAQDAA